MSRFGYTIRHINFNHLEMKLQIAIRGHFTDAASVAYNIAHQQILMSCTLHELLLQLKMFKGMHNEMSLFNLDGNSTGLSAMGNFYDITLIAPSLYEVSSCTVG